MGKPTGIGTAIGKNFVVIFALALVIPLSTFRQQPAVVALTFRPGIVWTLNCGTTSFESDVAKVRFDALKPSFDKIFGSFVFLPTEGQ